jgi:predicted glycosyltransferase involved in capsule biosynthesis
MKISIVTSYYNRKPQFINTLKTIKKSKQIDNVEVIVVDDCSSEEHKLEDIPNDFPFVKVITLKSEDRWYTNPCVPFNKAINAATGDIIVIQNPECLHVGDILDDIVNKITEDNYLTYAVYSLDKEKTSYLYDLPYDNEHIFSMINSQIQPMNNSNYVGEGQACWYNHSIHRPAAYHFVAAITKNNMDSLNGFDERYSNGIGFDDDELLHRIKMMGLKIEIHDSPFALHQWHYSENNFFAKSGNITEAFNRNQSLFHNTTQKLTHWSVNIKKNS